MVDTQASVDGSAERSGHGVRTWWQSLGSRRFRSALLLILIVGGVARVAWVAHAGIAPQFASDPEAYLLQGETIARGQGYTDPLIDIANIARAQKHEPVLAAQPASFYPPGYPVFVAGVTWAVWHTPIPDRDLVRTIEYLQSALGVLTILLVFLLGRRVFNARVGLFAAAIVAIYPNLITTTATLQFETVFITVLLLTVLVLLQATTRHDHQPARLAVSGVMMGAVALIHPTICLLVGAYLVARIAMRRPGREIVRNVAILTVAMVLVIMTWTIRNAVELHAFVPVATGAGPALCMARNPEATGSIDIGVLQRECAPPHTTGPLAEAGVQVNRYATSHAIRWVVKHPLSEVRMWWTRTHLAYSDDTSGLNTYGLTMPPGRRRTAYSISDDASLVVLGLAAMGVIIAMAKRRSPGAVFLVVATLELAAVPAILFGDPRYRVPAEPLFAIFAAVTLGAVAELTTRSRSAARAT